MRRSIWIVLALALAGCEKQQPRFEGPMRVALGDCAGPSVAWISGPRPVPFTQAELDRVLAAKPTPPPEADPPKPKDPVDTRQQAIDQARAAGILGQAALQQGGAFASLTGTGDSDDIYGDLLGTEEDQLTGGFGYGRAGFGPGGGVTGWGTIGTGRYGTIGRGTGSGYGVGGGRGGMGRTSSVPTVRIGQPSTQGELDNAIIRRYVRRNIQKIQYCYEKQLLVEPRLEGTISAQFFIGADGKVTTSTASGMDPEVASCVKNVILAIQFPKPKGGGAVQVSYPFTFRPAAGNPPPSVPAAGSAVDPPAPPPPPPAPPPAAKPVEAKPAPYQPGEHSPLRSQKTALEECFRKHPKPHGVAVVELAYDAAGAVTTAVVHGLDGDARACVADAAKQVKRTGPVPAAERCSIAFGDMPIAELPTIAITADAITYNGQRIAVPSLVVADTQSLKIAALFEKASADAMLAKTSKAPVTLVGPRVIRPLDGTPMKVVNRTLTTVRAAGEDPVLAAPRGAEWQLLRRIELPVVPVPVGTGTSWNTFSTTKASGRSERVVLSILITKARLWVGLSAVNEFQAVERDGTEWDKLAKTLAIHKASAFFVDREDLEIAAEDDTLYGDTVRVVDAATTARFTQWVVIDPAALSARPSL